ncbi:DUF11 domain-containing protein [bacterium]|nr:DUF11 domain-containing protein [bacterium]
MKRFSLYRVFGLCLLLCSSGSVFGATTVVVDKSLVSPADGEAVIGELVNFQISISNSGPQTVMSLSLTDLCNPAYLEYVSASLPPDIGNAEIGEFVWNDLTEAFGDLEVGDVATLSMTFRAVGVSAVAPAMNTAEVQGFDDQQEAISARPDTVTVNVIQACADDSWEPNGPNNLASIPTGDPIEAYICPAADLDYYNVDLDEAGTWSVRLYDLPQDYNLYVYGGPDLLGSSENPGTASEQVTVTVRSAQSLTVVVDGGRNFSYTEPYHLKVVKARAVLRDTDDFAPGEVSNFLFRDLPTGSPGEPAWGSLYLDSISPENLLGQAPVLPDGRLVTAARIPVGTAGAHKVVAEVKAGSQELGVADYDIHVTVPKVKLRLWIDDAWLHNGSYHYPVVNKVRHPDFGDFGATIVEVCCSVEPKYYSESTARVEISVADDKLGAPEFVCRRNGFGGSTVNVPFVDEGGGAYSAVTNIDETVYDQQLIFRFRMPSTLAEQELVNVTAKVYSPSDEELVWFKFPRQIRNLLGCQTVLFVNRNTMFRDHNDADVAELLANLYIHSEDWWGAAPRDWRAVIYYIDQYRDENVVRNWNNSTISYASEFVANEGARLNHQFMINRFIFYTPKPEYVLIVGNDEQFPFYRLADPVDEEKDWIDDGAGNPAMTTCLNSYYLTDDFYADWFMGSVGGLWQEGNVDLKVGRIIGDSAEDMLQLYLAGLNVNGHTGRAVMASVDGWELGYEPHPSSPPGYGYPDLISVPGSLGSRGIQVFNDTESPRTIDVLEPYPSGWASSFQAASNGGMDLFFIGGHNGYRGATIPEDSFGPADIPSKYHRFDDDNPLVMIVGCHGGLPVPHLGWPGGASNSMVYNVIHNGARAYYGASGFSYGSPGNLHSCKWGELLIQYNFYYFLSAGYQSRTLGYALQRGKINFPFGVGNNTQLDRKTVTEFNLFGIPWQNLDYPGGPSRAKTAENFMPDSLKRERQLMIKPRRITRVADNVYQQTFNVQTPSWQQQDFEGFDTITIADGQQQAIPDAPLLPAITKHSIALPSDGKILSLEASVATTTTIGQFNIPTVQVDAWTRSGIHYTADTNIDSLYPSQIAWSHEGEQNHHLISVFPMRHNPTTDETLWYPNIDVTVTYEAPVPFGILDFLPDEANITAGQTPSFSARVFNMGDTTVMLDGTLAVTDDATSDGFSTKTLSLSLAPGTIYDLQSSMAGVPGVGQYTATLSLSDGMNGDVTAQTAFSVVTTQLTNLKASWSPEERKSYLSVDIENPSDQQKLLTLAFVVTDSEGVWLETIYVDPVSIGAGEKVNVEGPWNPAQISGGTYKIQAVGALDGTPVNTIDGVLEINGLQGFIMM